MNYKKGSLWRKWDLQVHTPFSKLNNGFGDPLVEETLDTYIKSLFEKAISNQIAVIGVCDYFSVDGYKKINEYLNDDAKLQKLFSPEEILKIKDILILCNVEFRLNKFVGKDSHRINLHVLFSNDLPVKDIEEHFLHDLEFVFEKDPYTDDRKQKLKKDNLIKLGQRLASEHEKFKSMGDDLFIGMMNAVVDDDQISDQLRKRSDLFKGKYLIIVPADEDLSELDWDSQDHLARKLIIQKCNIIISSNEKTHDWGLGLKHKTVNDFIKEFATLKPCITSSDAHRLEDLFVIPDNKYTWIKSDPTFEGLKQLLYEPGERISLQTTEPHNKETYQIIDRVRFIDSSGKNLFNDDYIEINPDLNSIIGGRASGKSLLLYYIAKTISPKEVDERCIVDTIKHYDLEQKINLDFEVIWKDGTIDLLSQNSIPDIFDDSETEPTKRILYIPQNYLSQLSESDKTKDDSKLNRFILDIVNNYPIISIKYEEQLEKISEQNIKVEQALQETLNSRAEALRIHDEILKIGDVAAIKKYIEEIQLKLNKIKEASGLKDDEIQKYKSLADEKNRINLELKKIEEDKKSVKQIFKFASEALDEYVNNINDGKEGLNNPNIKQYIDSLFTNIEDLRVRLQILQGTELENNDINKLVAEDIANYQSKLTEIEKNLQPLVTRIKLQNELKELSKILEQENKKIEKIEFLTKQREQKKQKYIKSKLELIEYYKNMVNDYNDLKDVMKEAENLMGELEIDVEVKVNFNTFNTQCINEFLNKTDVKKLLNDVTIDDKEYFYESPDIDTHVDFIIKIFESIIGGKFKPIKGRTVDDALNCLFKDYYFIKFGVKYQGDPISHMSPGKRALVILKLLVHFSDDRYPILLDQPDDDLDNRSIYKDLVSFMKQRKLKRQIILVSHNANMVIGSDSEEIIVANQKGQGDEITNKLYKFEYVSGAIENSFVTSDNPQTLESKGIREHSLEILEGSQEAFIKREKKYDLHNRKIITI